MSRRAAGTVTKTDDGEVTGFTRLRLTASAEPGWRFAHWGDDPGDTDVVATFVENTWTILLYMSGDNELEGNLLEDINELEAADGVPSGINIIVLADGAERYSTASGNWSGTRAYRIRHDPTYLRAAAVGDALQFVEKSDWVANETTGRGLLHRLWHEVFE